MVTVLAAIFDFQKFTLLFIKKYFANSLSQTGVCQLRKSTIFSQVTIVTLHLYAFFMWTL